MGFNNQAQYRKIYDFLDKVAEVHGIDIRFFPTKLYQRLFALWEKLEGPLNAEITNYVGEIKIKELLDTIPLREQLTQEFNVLADVSTLKLKDIKVLYKDVIPLISSTEQVVPHPSINKYIENFQDQSIQEEVKKQVNKI